MANATPSMLEWTGIASAVVLVLTAIGKGAQIVWGWRTEVRRSRADGLREWEDKLSKREADFDAALDMRLKQLETLSEKQAGQTTALRLAFEIVAGELRHRDPGNSALRRAEQLLAAAFPLDPFVPPEMSGALLRIDVTDTVERN